MQRKHVMPSVDASEFTILAGLQGLLALESCQMLLVRPVSERHTNHQYMTTTSDYGSVLPRMARRQDVMYNKVSLASRPHVVTLALCVLLPAAVELAQSPQPGGLTCAAHLQAV